MQKEYIYKLLEIRPTSGKMLLLLYPPIYALWIFAIGKTLLRKQNKSDKTFTFFASGFVFIFFVAFLIAPILRLLHINYIDVNFFNNSIPGLIAILYWFVSVILVSHIMLNYEYSTDPEKHQNYIVTLGYAFVRGITLMYWFISIWFYQKKVNSYNL